MKRARDKRRKNQIPKSRRKFNFTYGRLVIAEDGKLYKESLCFKLLPVKNIQDSSFYK